MDSSNPGIREAGISLAKLVGFFFFFFARYHSLEQPFNLASSMFQCLSPAFDGRRINKGLYKISAFNIINPLTPLFSFFFLH